jgi:DNA primase catalytic core
MAMPASPIGSTEPADLDRLYAAHAAATTYYRAQLHRNHGPVNYLRERGLGVVVDREPPWRIGFAPRAWTALGDHLRRHGFTDDELLRGGLAFRSREGRVLDLFRDRIMFPIRDIDGRTVGFTARIWHPPSAGDPEPPKYLNSPDTPSYRKGQVLFGLHEQRDRITSGYPPVVVEGPTDALAIWSAYNGASRTGLVAVATCGTSVTADQLDIVANLPGARRYGIAAAFDGDDAGHKAAERTHTLLTAHHPDIVARGIQFAAGADPGDLAAQPDGRARLRVALQRNAEPLVDLLIDHRVEAMLNRRPQLLHEVEGRVLLARALAPLIADQKPAAVAAAVAHVGDLAVARAAGTPEGLSAAADTVHCLTSAVIDHLETSPAPGARSAPGPGPPAAAHPSATAFPTKPPARRPATPTRTTEYPAGHQPTATRRQRR